MHSLREPGVGPEDPCGSHPTWDTLGFCDQVQYFFVVWCQFLRLDGLHENFSSVCEKKTKVISSSDGFRKKTLKDISKEDTKLRRTTEYKYLFLWVFPGV